MAEIPIYQRNNLPPQQGPAAPPPFSLAAEGGMIRFGETMENFAGGILDKIVRTKVINEEHTFMGGVNTKIEEFGGWLKNNPNASINDMQLQRDKMMEDISKISDTLTTLDAQNFAKNWHAENKNAIVARTNNEINGAIRDAEQTKFNLFRETYIATGNKKMLEDIYQQMMQSGSLDKEIGKIALDLDMSRADAVIYDTTVENIRAQAQNIIDTATDKEDGKITAYELIGQAKSDGVLQAKDAGTLRNAMDTYAAGQKFAMSVAVSDDIGNLRKQITQFNQANNPQAALDLITNIDISKYTGEEANRVSMFVQTMMDRQKRLVKVPTTKTSDLPADVLSLQKQVLQANQSGNPQKGLDLVNAFDVTKIADQDITKVTREIQRLSDQQKRLLSGEKTEKKDTRPSKSGKSDSDALKTVTNAINGLRQQNIASSDYKRILSDLAGKLDDNDFTQFNDRISSSLSNSDMKLVNDSVSNFELSGRDTLSYQYRFALEDWLSNNPNVSEKQKYEQQAVLAAIYSNTPAPPRGRQTLEYLAGLEDTIIFGEDYKPQYGFTNEDVKKAKKIVGGTRGKDITSDMIDEFEQYINGKTNKKLETDSDISTRLISAPDTALDPYWDGLDDDRKRKVLAAIDNGYSASEIIAALGEKK